MSLPAYEHIEGGDTPTVRAYGVTHQELFENAALGVFALMWPVASIPPRYARPLVAPGDTLEELLANWVGELLHVGREEGLALSYFVVDRLEPGGVQGSAAGLPTHEVGRSGRVPVRVAGPASAFVSIPEGFWADLTIELEPKLRLI